VLPVLAKAPEITGITNWINSDPVTMASLRGKVVLIDFWTYTCINCIRTLPYVTSWYEKYKDDNFVVIGVHSPEFEFEKNTANVENAATQYGITYPIAQDNDFKTWDAYNNKYWPAHYLVDANGNIRYVHFGEGKYDETEKAIQKLIEEAGKNVSSTELTTMEDQSPRFKQTPETYLGSRRVERFESNLPFKNGVQSYTFPSSVSLDSFAYAGDWKIENQYSETVQNAKLLMQFEGNKVFLVMHTTVGNEKVTVYLDNKIIPADVSGVDVKDGVITLDEPRLYELVDLKGNRGTHLLRLEFSNGVQLYAFTFG
jgi:thiol-disulfide isomerase/thioredoxin